MEDSTAHVKCRNLACCSLLCKITLHISPLHCAMPCRAMLCRVWTLTHGHDGCRHPACAGGVQVVALLLRSNARAAPAAPAGPAPAAAPSRDDAGQDAAPSGAAVASGTVVAGGTPGAEGAVGAEGAEGAEGWPSDAEEVDYAHVLNKALPPEIRVLGWAPVPDTFNARCGVCVGAEGGGGRRVCMLPGTRGGIGAEGDGCVGDSGCVRRRGHWRVGGCVGV